MTRLHPSPAVRRWLAVSVAVLSLAAAYGPSFIEHMRQSDRGFHDDARQHIAAFLRPLQDRPQDYIENYWLACLPEGYRAFYLAGSRVWDPATISRFLPHVLLIMLLAALAFGACTFGGTAASWAIAALALSSDMFLTRMAGGLPRSFSFPIFALTIAAAVQGRIYLLAVSTILAGLFYPTVAVPSGLTLAFLLLAMPSSERGQAASWSFRKRVLVLGITGVLILGSALVTALRVRPYGPAIGPSDFSKYPEAAYGGRLVGADRVDYAMPVGYCIQKNASAIFRSAGDPWSEAARTWLYEPSHRKLIRSLLWIMILAGGAASVLSGSAGRRLLLVSAAAVLSYVLSAGLLSPLLFLPERHMAYTVPVLTLFWFIAAATSLPKIAGVLLKRWRKVFDAPLARSLCVVVPSIAVLLLVGGPIHPAIGRQIAIEKNNQLFEFVSALPEDSFIAGWPNFMQSIPYLCRRPALISLETHLPYHAAYTEEMRRRMFLLIDAYFASSVEPLIALRDRLGVTHLVLYTNHFKERPTVYFAPFEDYLRKRFREGRGNFEVIRQRPCAEVLSWGKLFVLDLSKLCVTNGPAPSKSKN